MGSVPKQSPDVAGSAKGDIDHRDVRAEFDDAIQALEAKIDEIFLTAKAIKAERDRLRKSNAEMRGEIDLLAGLLRNVLSLRYRSTKRAKESP